MPGRLSLGSPRSVGVLRGRQSVLLDDRVRGEAGQFAHPLAGVEDRHVLADQLQRIAVAGDHQHAVALVFGLGGQGGDQVVGLEARLGEHRDAQGGQDLLGDVDLAVELVGRRRPIGLVLRIALGRKVCRDTSKAAAMWVGASSRRRLISMAVKP